MIEVFTTRKDMFINMLMNLTVDSVLHRVVFLSASHVCKDKKHNGT